MLKNKIMSWLNLNKDKKEKVNKKCIDDNKIITVDTSNKTSKTDNVDMAKHNIYSSDLSVKRNLFSILSKKLLQTKKNFGEKIQNLFYKNRINDTLFNEIEEQLLTADIGADTTSELISNLIKETTKKELRNADLVFKILKQNMKNILKKVEFPLNISFKKLFVILVVGVNGVGKTSVIGKLAKKYKEEGKSVMLVAGDTFRAAAIDQLKFWAENISVPIIARKFESDPASVVFDALKAAKAKKVNVLIIDTAGRLHNKFNLMKELKKITTVIKKVDPLAPHETMLVLDSCIGQNSIRQVTVFNQELNITGLVITKLDGTAKGGVIFSIAKQLLIPIRYISFGESDKDIQIFNSSNFVDAIFNKNL